MYFFFLMIRRPPRATLTDTLFPYTTLFRSVQVSLHHGGKRQQPASDPRGVRNAHPPLGRHRVQMRAGRDQQDRVVPITDSLASSPETDRKSTRLNSSH